jgi:DnaK suppressor protein
LKPYPAENSFLMTAKKKVSSTNKSKTTKAKAAPAKAVAKKAVKKATPAQKKTVNSPVKKTAVAKKVAVSKARKPAKAKKPSSSKAVTKSPVKKTTKTASTNPAKVKGKATPKKGSVKKAPVQKEESNTISKVKEIVSKSRKKTLKEDSKAESHSFSFDDVIGFLKSKKKEKPKKQAKQKPDSTKVTKVQKTKEAKTAKLKKLTTASIDDILGFGAPVVGVSRPVRDESKVPKQWLPYYNALMSLRTALKGSLGERSSETIGASARESGELSINSSDAGTETFDRDLALSMVANDQEALEEIEDAIDRIFAGTYGVCLETKKPINKNRLKAVPFTRFSVEGQNQFERGKIKERDLGAGSFATLADSTMGEED